MLTCLGFSEEVVLLGFSFLLGKEFFRNQSFLGTGLVFATQLEFGNLRDLFVPVCECGHCNFAQCFSSSVWLTTTLECRYCNSDGLAIGMFYLLRRQGICLAFSEFPVKDIAKQSSE